MNNLPPGVTESMIPGCGADSAAEEKLYEELCEIIAMSLAGEEFLDSRGSDVVVEQLLRKVLKMQATGYNAGYSDGSNEAKAEALPVRDALQAMLEWGRTHTSPLDQNSPHKLLVAADMALRGEEPEYGWAGDGVESFR